MLNAFLAVMLVQASASAHDPCPAVIAPPMEMSGWASRRPLDAGRIASRATTLTPGVAVAAQLPSTREVSYVVPPKKPSVEASYGGIFTFTVATPGRYRIALGASAWIDVLANGKPATSVGHAHGPACTGIRKMVDFNLGAGRYVLQIAGNSTPDLSLMVTKLPA